MIGTKELLRLVKENKLVEDLSEREITNPEGAGFDFRVGEIFKIKKGEVFLGIQDRQTPETYSVAKYGKDKDFVLHPGELVLFTTIEKVNLPSNVILLLRPRLTLITSGIDVLTTTAAAGYGGGLTIPIKNLGENPFRIELGARFVHGHFFYTTENISNYRGQWQGGRTSTNGKKEIQV
jgi:deoxycytidine triphosphate deaminase